MKNFKWGTESLNDKPIHVVLFVSRNKDNTNVENFKERRISFITHEPIDSPKLQCEFDAFINQGVTHELSRMYYSINARDPQKIYKHLMHFMIDNPNFNLCSIQPKLAGIASKSECAAEKKWLFDFDIDDSDQADMFINDIVKLNKDTTMVINKYKTPHGFAIVTNRGFDARPLYNTWDNNLITLKRDALLCCHWDQKY